MACVIACADAHGHAEVAPTFSEKMEKKGKRAKKKVENKGRTNLGE
jgi:hypothetical protein